MSGEDEPLDATTLVIDDDDAVREILGRMLAPLGCHLLEAHSGELGLRIVERDEPAVDVVLTDFSMPGLNGLDVAEVLAEHRPDIPVAIVSSYAGAAYRVARRPGSLRILEKPFDMSKVEDLARYLVAESRRLRRTATEQRAQAEAVLERSAVLIARSAAIRQRVDLVAAAWAIHNGRREPR